MGWGPDTSIFKSVPPDESNGNSGPQKMGFQSQVNIVGALHDLGAIIKANAYLLLAMGHVLFQALSMY